jgi:hypothetical protein
MAHANQVCRAAPQVPLSALLVPRSHLKWEEECRLNGCDMAPHPDDVAAEEIAANGAAKK